MDPEVASLSIRLRLLENRVGELETEVFPRRKVPKLDDTAQPPPSIDESIVVATPLPPDDTIPPPPPDDTVPPPPPDILPDASELISNDQNVE